LAIFFSKLIKKNIQINQKIDLNSHKISKLIKS
jgi:hypothetical protein